MANRLLCYFCLRLNHNCNDRVQHSLTCPFFSAAFIAVHNLPFNIFDLPSILLFTHFRPPISRHGIDIALFYTLVAFHSFNKCKNGAEFSQRMIKLVIKGIISKSNAAQKLHQRICKIGYGDDFLER